MLPDDLQQDGMALSQFDLVYVSASEAAHLDVLPNSRVSYRGAKAELSAAPEAVLRASVQSAVSTAAIQTVTTASAELQQLAYASGIYSRFWLDPLIPRRAFYRLYDDWLAQCLTADVQSQTACLMLDNQLAGFIALRSSAGITRIELLATHEHFRGQGIGRMLLHWTAQRCLLNHDHTIAVATQAANAAALNFYQRSGFALDALYPLAHLRRNSSLP